MDEIYERGLSIHLLVAEDQSWADVTVYRHYTDGKLESQNIVFTPGDIEDGGTLADLARDTVRMIAEYL